MSLLTNSNFWSTIITTLVVISIIYLGYSHFKKETKSKRSVKGLK